MSENWQARQALLMGEEALRRSRSSGWAGSAGPAPKGSAGAGSAG